MKKMKVTKYQSLSPFSGEYHFFIFYFPTFLPFYLENIDWLFASFCKSFFEELSYHFSYFYMHIKPSTLYKTIYYYEYKSAIYLMPSLKGNNSPLFFVSCVCRFSSLYNSTRKKDNKKQRTAFQD